MNADTQKVYEAIRDEFDRRVAKLTPAEYKEVMDELMTHLQCCIDCCIDCWEEEEENDTGDV